MNKPLLAGLGAALVAGGVAYFVFDRAAEPDTTSSQPAVSEAPAPAGSVEEQAQTAPPSQLGPGDAQERHLVGVVVRENPAQSQAHIMRRGTTGVYRLQDKVPPDEAVLTSIQLNQVTLQPREGKEIVLRLENLSAEERFLYSPEVNLDEVEDVVGDLSEAETPEGKALQEKYPDPYKPCARIEDSDEQQDCEDKIDAEMDAAAEECEKLDDPDEYDRCLETAYRFTAEAAERAKNR